VHGDQDGVITGVIAALGDYQLVRAARHFNAADGNSFSLILLPGDGELR
jgi:hypothetical protein